MHAIVKSIRIANIYNICTCMQQVLHIHQDFRFNTLVDCIVYKKLLLSYEIHRIFLKNHVHSFAFDLLSKFLQNSSTYICAKKTRTKFYYTRINSALRWRLVISNLYDFVCLRCLFSTGKTEEFNCLQLGLHKTRDRFREKNIIKSAIYIHEYSG